MSLSVLNCLIIVVEVRFEQSQYTAEESSTLTVSVISSGVTARNFEVMLFSESGTAIG